MTGSEYRQALADLSMTPKDMAKWLGKAESTTYAWRHAGPTSEAAVAIRMRLAIQALKPLWLDEGKPHRMAVLYSDIAAIIALGGGE